MNTRVHEKIKWRATVLISNNRTDRKHDLRFDNPEYLKDALTSIGAIIDTEIPNIKYVKIELNKIFD